MGTPISPGPSCSLSGNDNVYLTGLLIYYSTWNGLWGTKMPNRSCHWLQAGVWSPLPFTGLVTSQESQKICWWEQWMSEAGSYREHQHGHWGLFRGWAGLRPWRLDGKHKEEGASIYSWMETGKSQNNMNSINYPTDVKTGKHILYAYTFKSMKRVCIKGIQKDVCWSFHSKVTKREACVLPCKLLCVLLNSF